MRVLIHKIESRFGDLGRWVVRNPWITIFLVMLCVAFPASQLPKLTVDTSTEAFFTKDDPALKRYDQFREQYGRDELIAIAINPPEVFNLDFLKKLKQFHQDLEARVPYLDEVTSLVNITSIRGVEGELIIEDLMENFPEDPQAIEDLKQRVIHNKLYKNLLISEDGRFTTVLVRPRAFAPNSASDGGDEFDTEEIISDAENKTPAVTSQTLSAAQNFEMIEVINNIVSEYNTSEFPIQMGGSPTMTYFLINAMMADVPKFTGIAISAIVILLFLLFRRISGVILPVVTVVLSVLCAIGFMSMMKVPITVVSQILPSFLMAVGIGDSVHLLTIFYQGLQSGKTKEETIVHAMEHSGFAVMMTSFTTAGGLLSFVPTKMAPISAFGLFGSIGVMLALFFTLLLLPALLSIIPIHAKTESVPQTNPELNTSRTRRFLDFAANISSNRPWLVITFSFVIFLIALGGVQKLRFAHNPIKWFATDHPLRIATESIDKELRGSITLEVVVDTGKENGIKTPEVMNRLEQTNVYAEQVKTEELFIGKSTSVVDTLKQLNQALNENNPEFYTVPQDRDLIAQEILLFENGGTDDLEKQVDSLFSQARITIKAPWKNANAYFEVLATMEKKIQDIFEGYATVTVTGMMTLFTRTVMLVMESMLVSYLIAFAVITLMMMLMLGDWKLGLWSMIPNFLPILFGLGVMGWAGLPLDLSSILVGSIALGLAVDDTVHFLHNFRRYYQHSGDVHSAIRTTLRTTGNAMLFTTTVLSIGFFSYMFSVMRNLFSFGLITGLMLIVALFADLFLAPAIIALISPKANSSSHIDLNKEVL